jgi:cephalosporin-C deacetylase-like acetyl esterase
VRTAYVVPEIASARHQPLVHLAARIWLPTDAEQRPVPAILEYLPYGKRDGTFERDALTHPYVAGFGYVAVRVDIRGTGSRRAYSRMSIRPRSWMTRGKSSHGWLRRLGAPAPLA